MPLYGQAFCATNGLGQPFQGVGPGSWEDGIRDYKALPSPGGVEYFDNATVASYSYMSSDPSHISQEDASLMKPNGNAFELLDPLLPATT
jgi:chitinase